MAKLAGFAVFNSVSFYLVFLFVASWLQSVDGIAPAHALGINTLAMILLLPVMLAAGWLSYRVGRKGLLLGAIALGFVAAVPLFELMLHDNLTLVVAGQFGMVLLMARRSASSPPSWSKRRRLPRAARRSRWASTRPSASSAD